MDKGFLSGESLPSILGSLGFSSQVETQLQLAELHGNTLNCLGIIMDYLERMRRVNKRLIEVASYPILLLGFLVFIMMGLRVYLLPQLEERNVATFVVNHFPMLLLTGAGFFICLLFLGIWKCKGCSRIQWYRRLVRYPLLGSLVDMYLTAFCAGEWGQLLEQGVDFSQICQLMKDQVSPLFSELGNEMESKMMNGRTFAELVGDYPFLKKELSLMIEYGEVKGRLGKELTIYAQKTWETFFYRLHRLMNVIQPLVFLFIAFMIVLIYAAMLLPLYHNLEVHL